MGYISNQWLNRGRGLRNRKYNPILVGITALSPRDDWSEQNKIVVELVAERENSEFHTVHLSGVPYDFC